MTTAKTRGLHIGIIMDGNGRWATAQDLPRLEGHAHGVEAVMELVRACPTMNVSGLTLFAFAMSNWKRDESEVTGLWELFHTFFNNHSQELIDDGVRLKVIGDRGGLPKDILKKVTELEERSKDNVTALLQVALNYDGIDEVARLIKRTIAAGVLEETVTSEYVLTHLDTEANVEPDILVRTGMPAAKDCMSIWRGSAFLPLQSAQSVCVATEVLWPDFTPEHLQQIIAFADPDSRLFGGQRQEK